MKNIKVPFLLILFIFILPNQIFGENIEISPILLQGFLLFSLLFVFFRNIKIHGISIILSNMNFYYLGIYIWSFGAFISALSNAGVFSFEVFSSFVSCFIINIIILKSFEFLPIDIPSLNKILLFFFICSSLFFLVGIKIYYDNYGVPNLQTLFFARYDFEEGSGFKQYSAITLGNVDRNATFLTLTIPPLVFFIGERKKNIYTIITAICLIIALLTLIIIQSRTLFVVIFCFFTLQIIAKNIRISFYKFFIVFFVINLYYRADALEVASILEEVIGGLFDPKFESDGSAIERKELMGVFLKMFFESPIIGIGPGTSTFKFGYTAHQFYIHQAVECGVFGVLGSLIATIYVTVEYFKVSFSRKNHFQRIKLLLISGPFCYFFYNILANGMLIYTFRSVWIGMAALLLGLYFNKTLKFNNIPQKLDRQGD